MKEVLANMLSKKEIRENKNNILNRLSLIDRKGVNDFVDFLVNSDFFSAPASTMFHGNFEGGLAAHSYSVYEEFDNKIEHYSLDIPKDSRFLTGICHDLCKVGFYVPNVLADGSVSTSKPYKVLDDFPFGHGEKSVLIAQQYFSLTNQESLIIRWHMSNYDEAWRQYKDKVEALHPEVMLFQNADKEVSLFRGL